MPDSDTTASRTSASLLLRLRSESDPDQWETDWRAFDARYRPLLSRWCAGQGLQPADIDEAVQEVMTKLAVILREFKYDPARSFRAYLATISRRVAADVHRWKQGPGRQGVGGSDARVQLENEIDHLADTLARLMMDEERNAILRQAMVTVRATANPDHWRVFEMRHLRNLGISQIAEMEANSTSAINVIVFRMRRAIREEAKRLGSEFSWGS